MVFHALFDEFTDQARLWDESDKQAARRAADNMYDHDEYCQQDAALSADSHLNTTAALHGSVKHSQEAGQCKSMRSIAILCLPWGWCNRCSKPV